MRLLKQKVDVFAALGDEGHDSELDHMLGRKRMENTLKFMQKNGIAIEKTNVLDIAGPSMLGQYATMAAEGYAGTHGDLDTVDWEPDNSVVDIVLMCEVIEHLLNPLLFLEELKKKVSFDVMVVTWPIRPSWLWTNLHFHEMRLDRFEYLCERAGYDLIAYKKDKIPTHWTSFFHGIRPAIRHLYNPHCNAIIKKI